MPEPRTNDEAADRDLTLRSGAASRFQCWYDSVDESRGSIFRRWRFTLSRHPFAHSGGRGHADASTPMAEDNPKSRLVAGTCDGNNGFSTSRLAGRGDLCSDLPLVVLRWENLPFQPRITRCAIRLGYGFDRASNSPLRVGILKSSDADDPSSTNRPFGVHRRFHFRGNRTPNVGVANRTATTV
jgi:hypothetical protein